MRKPASLSLGGDPARLDGLLVGRQLVVVPAEIGDHEPHQARPRDGSDEEQPPVEAGDHGTGFAATATVAFEAGRRSVWRVIGGQYRQPVAGRSGTVGCVTADGAPAGLNSTDHA